MNIKLLDPQGPSFNYDIRRASAERTLSSAELFDYGRLRGMYDGAMKLNETDRTKADLLMGELTAKINYRIAYMGVNGITDELDLVMQLKNEVEQKATKSLEEEVSLAV